MTIAWWWSPPRRPPVPWPPDDRTPIVPRLSLASWYALHAAEVRDRLRVFEAQAERRVIVAEHLGLRRARRQAALETLADDLDKQTGYALGLLKLPGKRARPRRGAVH